MLEEKNRREKEKIRREEKYVAFKANSSQSLSAFFHPLFPCSALRPNPARGPRWPSTWLACLATALSFVRGFIHWQSSQEVGSHPAAPWDDDHQLAQLTACYRMVGSMCVCVSICGCACFLACTGVYTHICMPVWHIWRTCKKCI